MQVSSETPSNDFSLITDFVPGIQECQLGPHGYTKLECQALIWTADWEHTDTSIVSIGYEPWTAAFWEKNSVVNSSYWMP